MSKPSRDSKPLLHDTHSIAEYSNHSWIAPPWCQVPPFNFENKEQSRHCGYAAGRVIANYLTVLILISAGVMIWAAGTGNLWLVPESQPASADDVASAKTIIGMTVAGAVALIVLAKIIMPRISRYFNGYNYDMYQANIKSYVATGMSRAKAVKLVQKQYIMQLHDLAMMQSASIVASRYR